LTELPFKKKLTELAPPILQVNKQTKKNWKFVLTMVRRELHTGRWQLAFAA
jgi:hypothetical protein